MSKWEDGERARVLEAARALRPMPWQVIAKQFGVSRFFLQSNLDPTFDTNRRRAQINARRRERAREQGLVGSGFVHTVDPGRATAADAAERLKEIPADTRTLTGSLLGDPLPGRSALDRERRARA